MYALGGYFHVRVPVFQTGAFAQDAHEYVDKFNVSYTDSTIDSFHPQGDEFLSGYRARVPSEEPDFSNLRRGLLRS